MQAGTPQCVHFLLRVLLYCTPLEHSTVSLFSPKPVCSIVFPFCTNRQTSVSFGIPSEIFPFAFQLLSLPHWLVAPAPISSQPYTAFSTQYVKPRQSKIRVYLSPGYHWQPLQPTLSDPLKFLHFVLIVG